MKLTIMIEQLKNFRHISNEARSPLKIANKSRVAKLKLVDTNPKILHKVFLE